MPSRFNAYMGRILEVDLTSSAIGEYPLSDRDRELFVGGKYIATKILWDELKPGTDPLSPDNILVVMTSPLNATGAPSSSRYDISSKSPATGLIGHSNSGGSFGIRLKRAGFDGIVVRGRAEKPVFLEINNGKAEIRSAENMWGMDTTAAQEAMGDGGTMAIGPAGENMVPYAAVVSQERCHGRTGMGAVMGSKNLKGMTARGKMKPELHDPEKFKKTVRKWIDLLKAHPMTGDRMAKYGTAGFLSALSAKDGLPTRNFTSGTFKNAHKISGEALAEKYLVKNSGCVTCPIRCSRIVEVEGKNVKGPEFEILGLMGSNLMVDDLEAIIRWNYELDLLGLDTISTGNVLGFAMELNQNGLWDNGLSFGDVDAVTKVLPDIAYKRGVGADLAMGVKYLSEKYGMKESAAHSKGLEFAAYEPRASVGHGLGYATSNRGACHLDGGYLVYFEILGPALMNPFTPKSKPGWTIFDQNLYAAISAGGNCIFTCWTLLPPPAYLVPDVKPLAKIVNAGMTQSGPLIDMSLKAPASLMGIHLPLLPHSKALEAATGMKMSFGKYMQIGERGFNLERLFNLREGMGDRPDALPKKFTDEPLKPGQDKFKVPLDKMMPKYYSLRGWDENGRPTKKTLNRLSLDFLDVDF